MIKGAAARPHFSRTLLLPGLLMLAATIADQLLTQNDVLPARSLPVTPLALSHPHDAVTSAALALNWTFQPVTSVILLTLTGILVAAQTQDLRLASNFLATVAIPTGGGALLKSVLTSPHAFSNMSSYPSGHVVFVTAVAIACYPLTPSRRTRAIIVTVGLLTITATAAAAVYLGLQHPIDVLASLVWTPAAIVVTLTLWNTYLLPRTYRRDASKAGGSELPVSGNEDSRDSRFRGSGLPPFGP